MNDTTNMGAANNNSTARDDSSDSSENKVITSQLVADDQRIPLTARLFGIHFPVRLEPFVFGMAGTLAAGYHGGYWQFHALSNGGFYMAPRSDRNFNVACDNGFEGQLSADALGVVCCLYAYSHLSFGDGAFAGTCAEHYHLLREYMFGHAEVRSILRAID